MKKSFGMLLGLACFGVAASAYMNAPPEQRNNPTKEQKIGYAFFAILGGACMWKGMRSPGMIRRGAKGILDAVVLMWTPADPYRVRDLVANICVIGRTGSGKSSGSGLALANGIVKKLPHSGLLILASKPEDKAFWQGVFTKAGRSKDLLIFEPGGDRRFDPIDFDLKTGGDARQLTAMVMTVGETVKRSGKQRGGTNDGGFWETNKERGLHSGIEIVHKATGGLSIPDLAAFISDAAVTPEQTSDAVWRQGIHYRHLLKAYAAQKTPAEEHDYTQAFDYWTKEVPRMDAKVRSSIFADIMGTLHVLNTGVVRTLLSEGTNVSPRDLEQGKSILVNMPFHQYGASGIAVNAMWKLSAQKHLLKRRAASSPIIIWCDEYQNVANSFDAAFLAECRSHLAGMVVLTQSIHSFHSSMGHGGGGDHEAKALLANFTTKIFHALGDAETATFASELVGRDVQQRGSFSKNPCGDLWNEMMGQGSMSYSSREQVEEILLPRIFMHGLRTGGEVNNFECDAIVVKSGEPFAWGGNYLKVAFSQKG